MVFGPNLNCLICFSVHKTTDSVRRRQRWPVRLFHARSQAKNRQEEIYFQEKSSDLQGS